LATALWLCLGCWSLPSLAAISLHYEGALLEDQNPRSPGPPEVRQVVVDIELNTDRLNPDDRWAGASYVAADHKLIRSAVVSDGVHTFDFNRDADHVELILETDDAGLVARWRILAHPRVGNTTPRVSVLGPGYSIGGCWAMDVVADPRTSVGARGTVRAGYLMQSCRAGRWTVITHAVPLATLVSKTPAPCRTPPLPGDVIIYRAVRGDSQEVVITHSGVVRAVQGCKVLSVLSKEEAYGGIGARSPDHPYLKQYGSWAVYRTNRAQTHCASSKTDCSATDGDPNRLLSDYYPMRAIPLYRSYWTDKGTAVRMSDLGMEDARKRQQDFQCHGFTFGGQQNTSVDIEGKWVQTILDENAYRQIDAQGPDGSSHYDPRFGPL
jgi:hypothetical protein